AADRISANAPRLQCRPFSAYGYQAAAGPVCVPHTVQAPPCRSSLPLPPPHLEYPTAVPAGDFLPGLRRRQSGFSMGNCSWFALIGDGDMHFIPSIIDGESHRGFGIKMQSQPFADVDNGHLVAAGAIFLRMIGVAQNQMHLVTTGI